MIRYEFQGKIAVITGASKDEVEIEIPTELEGKPVSKIEAQAFTDMPTLKKVIIPKTVKVIGPYAFANCPMLSEVVFEEGLETIEDWAFISCNLESVLLPKSIKTIGANAFLGNMCKGQIDEFLKERDEHKTLGRSNGHAAAFPIELMEAKESINSDIVASRARYVDEQFEKITVGEMTAKDLDIPFYFDGDEFMVAVWHKKEMPNITFEVAGESKPLIGMYSENDPDFLVLKINVLANKNLVSTFSIKVPYLEGIMIENKGVEVVVKDGLNYCFVRAQILEANYGNGNYDREFAINQYSELAAKFETQFKNKLITEDQHDEIKDAIDQDVIQTTQGFLAQIDGCPKWTYLINLKRKMEDDPLVDQVKLSQYIFEHTVEYYNALGSIYSLIDIIWEHLDEHVKAIEELTGLPISEVAKKYDVEMVNQNLEPISEEEAMAYKAKFMTLDTNYNLHGDFLIYIYKGMQKLSNKFGLFSFQA